VYDITHGIAGPSYSVDSACSSSCYVLEQAYRAIHNGCCDAAIVAVCHLSLHPYISLQFSQLGVLSPEGMCKVFDNDGKHTLAVIFSVVTISGNKLFAFNVWYFLFPCH
jgi:acyl transferase domain-containing protein